MEKCNNNINVTVSWNFKKKKNIIRKNKFEYNTKM